MTQALVVPAGLATLTLQPGLLTCYTTAADIGATDAGRTFEGNAQFIHFNCQLAGIFCGRLGQRRLEFSAGQMSYGYAAGERFHVRDCSQLQNIEVMATPEILSALVGSEACNQLGVQHNSRVFIRSARANRACLRTAQTLAKLLTHSPHQRLRIHATTLEFLHWQLAAFTHQSERPQVTAYERNVLMEAKRLLLHDLAHPPTIAQLAETIGMNQCRLKQAFKAQFGTTIYALFQHERMSRAHDLLRRHNVTETAGQLGYSNISHFSAAFFNQWGCLPSQIRRDKMSLKIGLMN